MAEKAGTDQPPPYTAIDHGPGQYPVTTSQQGGQQGGQTNYGYAGAAYPGYPYQGQFVGQPLQQQQIMNNVVVTQVGGYAGPIYQPIPYDYTTQAWIACLCCFWPTGILAIMKASESRDALARGDLIGSQLAANSARTFVRISFGVGISVVFVAVLAIILSATLSY